MSNIFIPSSMSDTSVTFFDPENYGNVRTIADDNPNFDVIRDLITSGTATFAELAALASPVTALREQFAGVTDSADVANLPLGLVAVTRLGVTYNGEPMHDALSDRLLAVFNEGGDILPWVRFMELVKQNPYQESAEELYLWLTKAADMPILPDGRFLAYKAVNLDYTSIHDGRTMNAVGTTVVMPGGRAAVDAERRRTCSTGLHFCSKSYLQFFGRGSAGRVLLLAVSPLDVVSIPDDHDNAKGRAVQYEVVGEIDIADTNARQWGAVWTPPSYNDEIDDVVYGDDSDYFGPDDDDDDDEYSDDVFGSEELYDVFADAIDLLLTHGWRSTKSAPSSGYTVLSAIQKAAVLNDFDPAVAAAAAWSYFGGDKTGWPISHLTWDSFNDEFLFGDKRKIVRAMQAYTA
jgi:hypothetical protein